MAAERSAVLLRNEGALLPLSAGDLRSIAVIGPLADSQRDTIGPWVFDYDLDETVTVLEGIAAKVGGVVQVEYAPGIPAGAAGVPVDVRHVRRATRRRIRGVSTTRPSSQKAVELAARARCRGGRGRRVAEHDRRGRIAVVLELPGRQLELLQAVVATGTPVVLLVHERASARSAVGCRQRAGDSRHLVPGHTGRRRRREPAVRGRLTRREAALQLAADGRAGADDLHATPSRTSRRTSARRYWDEESTPLFPFGYGLSYGRVDFADLDRRPAKDRHRRVVTVSVEVTNTGHAAPTRSFSSTSTSAMARRPGRSGSSRASNGSA